MVFPDLNTIKDALQIAGKIELYPQILESQEKLLELQAIITGLEADNKELREELGIKGKLIPEGNLYWLVTGELRDGPYCTCCWDDEHKLMRLHKREHNSSLYCPKCNTPAKSDPTPIFHPIDHRRNSAM